MGKRYFEFLGVFGVKSLNKADLGRFWGCFGRCRGGVLLQKSVQFCDFGGRKVRFWGVLDGFGGFLSLRARKIRDLIWKFWGMTGFLRVDFLREGESYIPHFAISKKTPVRGEYLLQFFEVL